MEDQKHMSEKTRILCGIDEDSCSIHGQHCVYIDREALIVQFLIYLPYIQLYWVICVE